MHVPGVEDLRRLVAADDDGRLVGFHFRTPLRGVLLGAITHFLKEGEGQGCRGIGIQEDELGVRRELLESFIQVILFRSG